MDPLSIGLIAASILIAVATSAYAGLKGLGADLSNVTVD